MPEEATATPPAEKPKARRSSRIVVSEFYRLHLHGTDVWLNTEVSDYDGICLGIGVSREGAIDDAIDTLTHCLIALKKAKARG